MNEVVNAPDFFDVRRAMENADAIAKGNDAADKLRGKEVERIQSSARSYISPTNPSERFLVTPGKVEEMPYQMGGVMGLKPALSRIGDIWCQFTAGVCTTEDPILIDWLEAHAGDPELHGAYHRSKNEDPRACTVPIGLCREQGPGIDVWVQLKAGQIPTASRGIVISPEVDVDAFMRGDYGKGNKSLKSGLGAQMAETAQSDLNAAAERAEGGNRN